MPFRQKIKSVFHRPSSSPAVPEPPLPTNHSTASFPIFSIRKTKTNTTTKTAATTTKEALKREKREKKEQKKREKRRNNSKPKIELYKPYEIPPSKYRGPWDADHQRKLKAYTFTPSGSSARVTKVSSLELSPTATRAPPSRRESDVSDKIVVDLIEGDIADQPEYRPHLHHPFSHEQGFDESESEPTTMVNTDIDSPSRSRLTVQTEKTVVEGDTDMIPDIKTHPTSLSPTRRFSPEQLAEALNATRLST
ncbi:hypothetical protein FQN54_004543 [Arachnomyces sp. PD_36]|nr:hypothetical protein FQN54_004543 [Arachnomyces sp. PD_36]